MPLPLIIAAIGAAASVAGATKGGIDADKKRKFEQQLTFLNNEEKLKLEAKLRDAKSEEERIRILSTTLEGISSARVKGLSTVQVEKEKTKKQLLTLGIVGGVLVILTIIIVSRK